MTPKKEDDTVWDVRQAAKYINNLNAACGYEIISNIWGYIK
jgi:hypothetical protein